MSELTKRIIVAITGIPLGCIVFYIGGVLFSAVIAVLSSIAIIEFYQIAEKKGYPVYKPFGVLINIIPIMIYSLDYYKQYFGFNVLNLTSLIFPCIISLTIITLLIYLFSKSNNMIAGIGVTFAGFMYISVSFFSLILLRNFEMEGFANISGDFGFYIVVIMFCAIWLCDSMAYFIGKSIGKHKLMKHVSPKKTIEGTIAGFIASAVFVPFAITLFVPNFDIKVAIIIGVSIGIFGQIGDLVESKIKRDANVKDSSNIIPGHGGILDRFDSILFASPLVLLILLLFM